MNLATASGNGDNTVELVSSGPCSLKSGSAVRCGHAQEVIPWPRADGLVAFVAVLGEAR